MLVLVLWICLALVICHVCSLLEATLLAARQATLQRQKAAGSRGAARLLDLRRERLGDAISAILILNTFGGIVGAGFAGAQAAKVLGEAWVAGVTLVMTVLLLVLAEILPKTLASLRPSRFAAPAGDVLFHLLRLLAPLLLLTRALTRLLAKRSPEAMTRVELAAEIITASREGAISAGESELLGNLLQLHRVTLRDVHTPAAVIFMLDAEATAADLLGEPEADAFSRIPLFRGERGHVVGYVFHREVLKSVAVENNRARRLLTFLRPIPRLEAALTVRAAIERLLGEQEAIALVETEGRLLGLVTLEDLLEAVLGVDITDEPAEVTELRRAADRERRRRTEKMRRQQQERQARLDL